MICDAHCHLDLMDDMIGFINEIQHSNIGLFAVGTTPKAYSRDCLLYTSDAADE